MKRYYYVFALCSSLASAQSPVMDAAHVRQAVKKLNVLGRVLYIAAHPDDENTALLAYCANEKLWETAYLSMSRGDGGQNLIGSEQGEVLGVIRTQELLAARRIDGARQFFTRAIDFGYSKSPEETLTIWNHQEVLADVVWVIRRFRPDVIITRFPPTGEGGHGQHTASALLAEEAFRLAADPKAFPEQLKLTTTWQAKRILWNAWPQAIKERKLDLTSVPKIDLGTYNELFGKSYTELAAESRSMHKSQGFGVSATRGERWDYYLHRGGDSARTDIFESIDDSWDRVAGTVELAGLLRQAAAQFDPENPSGIFPILIKAYQKILTLPKNDWVEAKRVELEQALTMTSGLWTEALSGDYSAAPGGSVKVTAGIVNRSRVPLMLRNIQWNAGGSKQDSVFTSRMNYNQPIRKETILTLDGNAPISHPYWLTREHGKGTYVSERDEQTGLPESDAPATVRFDVGYESVTWPVTIPVVYRWTDPVRGELQRPFFISPPVTMQWRDELYLFPNDSSRTVALTVKAWRDQIKGTIRLKLPAGWRSEPSAREFQLNKKEDESVLTFVIVPEKNALPGVLTATATTGDRTDDRGRTEIQYPHIPTQVLFPKAQARLVPLSFKSTAGAIGYVMGSGDRIPDDLLQLGMKIQLLSDEELENGDLSRYRTIVTGVRAYNTRDRLRFVQERLMEFVRKGGTLLVQYNTANELKVKTIGPYPFTISRNRITNEEAPLDFLKPDHPVLNNPNRITADDFSGWVQERGLYFASDWDPKYETILSGHDTGEKSDEGSLLVAKFGEGYFVYSGLAFFRQLPAGVPGAYRLFINLMSLGHTAPDKP